MCIAWDQWAGRRIAAASEAGRRVGTVEPCPTIDVTVMSPCREPAPAAAPARRPSPDPPYPRVERRRPPAGTRRTRCVRLRRECRCPCPPPCRRRGRPRSRRDDAHSPGARELVRVVEQGAEQLGDLPPVAHHRRTMSGSLTSSATPSRRPCAASSASCIGSRMSNSASSTPRAPPRLSVVSSSRSPMSVEQVLARRLHLRQRAAAARRSPARRALPRISAM